MKQKTKHLPDYDARGRQRRFTSDPWPLVTVKFIDGPLAGRVMQLPDDDSGKMTVGGLRYSYAGKERHTHLYARIPSDRASQRAIAAIIRTTGKDPRVTRARMRGILK